MKKSDIEVFYKTRDQLNVAINEISELKKKKPNDAVNIFKLKFINSIIKDANQLLGDELKPFPEFTTFDEDELPSNSDVTFMLTQYKSRLSKFLMKNSVYSYGKTYWIINGKQSEIETI